MSFRTDGELLERVLRVYTPECRYLTSAEVAENEHGLVVAVCEFAIPGSFYIDDTGHFNAVEFNLCYNQMMYYAVAKSVKEGLMGPFATWTLDEYWDRQLADFLIVDFRSTFKRGIDAARFSGEITFSRIRETGGGRNWQPMVLADTAVRYWDDAGGQASGDVRLAVTRPPTAARTTSTGEGA
ncbi:FcoT family thioesterase [Streptomyces sp. NPDC058623]|uniref:FcoT family thioesterase n=1 Tax=Streptomyces sp. NPDC058623 TaxID=3346563 RepID=UPI003653C8DB